MRSRTCDFGSISGLMSLQRAPRQAARPRKGVQGVTPTPKQVVQHAISPRSNVRMCMHHNDFQAH